MASGDAGAAGAVDVFAVRRVLRGPPDTTVLRITVPATRPLCWVPFFVPSDIGTQGILALQEPDTLASGSTALWRGSRRLATS